MPPVQLPVTAEELEFFAEEEPITIVPSFSVPNHPDSVIEGIVQNYGPFQPNIPAEVPIWLAIQLHKSNKARILPPPWLKLEHLTRIILDEQSDASSFQSLPFYFMEIACLLFEDCKACFGDEYQQVREKLQQLVNIRRNKIEQGLRQVVSAATVRINNLSAYESNLIRLTFQGSLNMFLKMEAADPGGTQTGTYSATVSTRT